MRSVYFLELANPPFFGEIYLPYVWGSLRAYCEQDPLIKSNYHWHKPVYWFTSIDDILSNLREPPKIFGFSGYVWSWHKCLAISRRVKEKFPTCQIVFGGPQIENNSKLLSECPWVDFTVCGEGELPFLLILKELLQEQPNFSEIPGIYFRDNEHIRSGAARQRMPKNLEIPSPYLAGFFDEISEEIVRGGNVVMARFETNRGCPYRCAYCDWGTLTNSRVHHFSQERVFAELNYFAEKSYFGVWCVDANFGLYAHDTEIVKTLCQTKKVTGYPRYYFSSMAKNSNERVFELSKMLFTAGLLSRGGNLSVQSMTTEVLTAIDRQMIGTRRYMELKEKYTAHGIPTLTEIIMGLPEETFASFRQSFYTLQDAGFHEGFVAFPLVLLPNTPMNEPSYREKYQIKTVSSLLVPPAVGESPECFEHLQLVVGTRTMTPDDWVKMRTFANFMMIFHGGGPLRFLALYLNKEQKISFKNFYDAVFFHGLENASSVLGQAFSYADQIYHRIISDRGFNQAGSDRFTLNYQGERIELEGSPYRYMWLKVVLQRDLFFTELKHLLEKKFELHNEQLDSILAFQKTLWFQPEYDPGSGKTAEFDWDWLSYFNDSQKRLIVHKTHLHFADQKFGAYAHVVPIAGDLARFCDATQGNDPVERQRYVHQLEFIKNIDSLKAGA